MLFCSPPLCLLYFNIQVASLRIYVFAGFSCQNFMMCVVYIVSFVLCKFSVCMVRICSVVVAHSCTFSSKYCQCHLLLRSHTQVAEELVNELSNTDHLSTMRKGKGGEVVCTEWVLGLYGMLYFRFLYWFY